MAGAGAAPKGDDTQPHPVKDQLPGISYCITSPPPWREFLLLNFFFFSYGNNFMFISYCYLFSGVLIGLYGFFNEFFSFRFGLYVLW